MKARPYAVQLSFVTFFISSLAAFAGEPDRVCLQWFKISQVKAGTDSCELTCTTQMTDMATFTCPMQCDALCNLSEEKNLLGKLIYYPGLTPTEKKLVEKYPGDALIVFIQKTHAESASSRNFPEQGLNDEGDAFRHFIWAGLLTKELGAEKAKDFLDAHEANPLQRNSERDMDKFNNEKGVSAADDLISHKRWSPANLEKTGLDMLREKSLKVLAPGLKIPEVPK